MKQGQCLREQESPEAHGNVSVWLGEDTPDLQESMEREPKLTTCEEEPCPPAVMVEG